MTQKKKPKATAGGGAAAGNGGAMPPDAIPPLEIPALLSAISDVVSIADRDGRFLWVATTLPTREGPGKQRAGWITGKRFHDLTSEAEADRLLACLRTALETGETQTIEYQGDMWGRRVWFSATASRLTDDTVVWVGREITDRRQTDEDLLRWQERHLALVNSVDAVLWEADPDFKSLFVSEQAERLLGYPVERWLNEPDFWANHIHPEDRDHCLELITEKIAAREALTLEYRMVAADGRTVWLRDIVTVVVEDGEPVALRGVMIDITELKETFHQLSQQEEQYRAIFESTSDGLVVTDAENRIILAANPAFHRIYGYEDDMTGMALDQIRLEQFQSIEYSGPHAGAGGSQNARIVTPDMPDTVLEQYTQTARAGGQLRRRIGYVRKDGTAFHVEALGRAFTYQGKPAILGVVRDITEQVEAEERLNEAFESLAQREEQYRAIFETSSDGLIINDAETGTILAANPAACRMYGLDDLTGKHPHELLEGFDSAARGRLEDTDRGGPHVLDEYMETVRAGGEFRRRISDVRKDGTPFHVEVFGRAFTYHGKPATLAVVHDITEQVQAEQQLREAFDSVAQREEQYRGIFEATRDGMIINDAETGLILEANPALHRLYGYDDMTGMGPADFIQPENLHLFAEYAQTVREGREFRTRARELRTDGTPFYVDAFGRAFTYKGKPAMLGVLHDITEQVQAEERLKEAFESLAQREEQYRAIFETTSDGLIINDSETGVVLEANPAFHRMHGYDDMRGMHPTSFIHPDSHHLFDEYVEAIRAGEEYRCRAKDIRSDGTVFDVEVLGRAFTYQGKPAMLGVVRDVTDQVRGEQMIEEAFATLAEREQQYRSIFESTKDGLVIHAKDDLRVVEANPAACEMYGYETGGLTGLFPGEFILPDSYDPDFINAVNDGRPTYTRARGIRKDGSQFEMESTGIPFAYKGEPHLLCVQRDVTDLVRNQELLEERVEARTRELSALLEVSRNVSSTLELKPLLRMILKQVQAVTDCHRAAVFIPTANKLEMLDSLTDTDEDAPSPDFAFPIAGVEPLWDPIKRGEPVIIPDVRADNPVADAYREASGDLVNTTFRESRSWMGLPLISNDQVIGALTVTHRQPNYYTERHARLAEAIANQAAAAIDNARLYQQTEERSRELSGLLEVARGVTSTLDLDQVVRLILDQLQSVIPYKGSTIMLLEDGDLVVFDSRSPDGLEAVLVGRRIPAAGFGALWDQLNNRRHVIIDDVWSEERFSKDFRDGVGGDDDLRRNAPYVRSWLGLPLAVRGRIIGVLGASMDEAGYFSEDHVRVMGAFADQAAIAIENARLYHQVSERSRELSAVLEVSHAIASTLDMDQLLETVMDHLQSMVHCLGVSIGVVEDDALVTKASRVAPGRKTPDPALGVRIPLDTNSDLWKRITSGRHIIIDDIHGDSEEAGWYRAAVGHLLTDDTSRFVRSWMSVPMKHKDITVGILSLSTDQPGFYTPEHARLASAIASHAAVAIENARLYEQAGARSRELATLLEVSRDVASTLDLDALLGLILDRAARLVPYHRATFSLVDSDTIHVRAERDSGLWPKAEVVAMPIRDIPFGRAAARLRAAVVSEGKPILIDDVEGDSELAVAFRETKDVPATPHDLRIRSWMGVPVAVKDRVIGVLSMARKEPGYFTQRHAELVLALTSQAAVAVENARLYEQAHQLAAIQERQRLARELHDSVSQALYAIGLGAQTARTLLDRDPARAVEPVDYVLSLAEAGLAEMRALIFELRPESLETEGLMAAIGKQVAATRARYGIDVSWTEGDEPSAPLPVKEAVYRIVQEALHNIVKHAKSPTARVVLAASPSELTFEISDDGVGFDPSASFAGHLGLHSMRERAANLGGHLEAESAPGKGTIIRGAIPIS